MVRMPSEIQLGVLAAVALIAMVAVVVMLINCLVRPKQKVLRDDDSHVGRPVDTSRSASGRGRRIK